MTAHQIVEALLDESGAFEKLGLLSQMMNEAGFDFVRYEGEADDVTVLRHDTVELKTLVVDAVGEQWTVLFTLTGPAGSRSLRLKIQESTNLSTVLKQLLLIAKNLAG